MKYKYEYTDTFGGQANYCWVDRGEVEAKDDRMAVRKVKEATGLTGHRCKREEWGETIALRPQSMCRILFIEGAEQ
jgi:hypothetical protein